MRGTLPAVTFLSANTESFMVRPVAHAGSIIAHRGPSDKAQPPRRRCYNRPFRHGRKALSA
ncbi:hypothetical protein RugamoR64_15690 [Duganella rhizosphaerae]